MSIADGLSTTRETRPTARATTDAWSVHLHRIATGLTVHQTAALPMGQSIRVLPIQTNSWLGWGLLLTLPNALRHYRGAGMSNSGQPALRACDHWISQSCLFGWCNSPVPRLGWAGFLLFHQRYLSRPCLGDLGVTDAATMGLQGTKQPQRRLHAGCHQTLTSLDMT